MPRRIPSRLPSVRTLFEMLPKGAEGGKEFARIVDLLLFHESRRTNKKVSLFSDVAGDYHGLDSFAGDTFRKEGTTGYQYKFFPSPLSDAHRNQILKSLERTAKSQKQLKLKRWVLVTPQNLIESGRRSDGGDVTWFEGLRKTLGLKFELEHWGHNQIIGLFLETPALCLFYYPELVPDGLVTRKTIQEVRARYDANLLKLYKDIQFVGMNVRKQEATKGVPMEHIYIPLSVVPEGVDDQDPAVTRKDPIELISENNRQVILGDPGSGKSTLLKFLTLVGISEPLQQRYGAQPDQRLPIFITLRRYADELKARPNLSLIKHIQEIIQSDFNLNDADGRFFDYYLESGQAVLLFDGLDELPGPSFKEKIRDQIRTLVTTYPQNATVVTSRIVGYSNPFRFDEKEFGHHRLTKLRSNEMKQFVEDWYAVRIENERDREDHVRSLVTILENPEQKAIFDLAENPLLLTIIALVHRIDGVLPDARVVLYRICTETLLESWHRWKFKDLETKNRGREERRNKQRMEAIAHWMQNRSVGGGKTQRAVVPFADLNTFLSTYIRNTEKLSDNDDPLDLAEEFLRFVKERAGLLIELGDNEYSFVHLTFQEYLTASYIKTTSELEGIAKAWEKIDSLAFNSRWHEVMRLLIAALDSNISQQFLVEKLLSKTVSKNLRSAKAQLLGGILLDGIEAAEDRVTDILQELVQASAETSDTEQIRATTGLMALWLTKESNNESILVDVVKQAYDTESKKIGLTLGLTTVAIGFCQQRQAELLSELIDRSNADSEMFHLLFDHHPMKAVSGDLVARLQRLWATQDSFMQISPEANLLSASCQAVTGFLPPDISAKRLFFQILLSTAMGRGPYNDFVFNTCRFIQYAPQISHFLRDGLSGREEVSSFDGLRQLLRPLTHYSRRQEGLDFKDEFRLKARANYKFADPDSFSDPLLSKVLIDLLCESLMLEPRVQWAEALRTDFVPRIRYRLPQLNEHKWTQIESSFRSGRTNTQDEFIGGWILLLDTWLFVQRYYSSPEESPFETFVALTRDHKSPPLQLSHCIRDIAFGNDERMEDLTRILSSEDLSYQEIFSDSYSDVEPVGTIVQPRKRRKRTTTERSKKK